jgi:hypothetical protein
MCTPGFDLAAVASVGGRAVSNELALMIDFGAYQRNSHGTLPGIPIPMKPESACAVMLGAAV